jgi:hypothetical protein
MRVRKIARTTNSLVMPVLPSAWINSVTTGRIFMKFHIWVFFKNLSRKFKFHSNLTRMTGTLLEEKYTFIILYRSIPPIMINAEICREN